MLRRSYFTSRPSPAMDSSLIPSVTQPSSNASSSSNIKRRRLHRSTPANERFLGPRPTQRAPKSCLECTRRKIRCDKNEPCQPCADRGESDDCRREAVYVKGAIVGGSRQQKATTLEGLAKEVEALKQRISLLEGRAPREDARGTDAVKDELGPLQPPVSEVDQGRLPGTLEEIALGIGEPTRWKGASLLSSRDDPTTSPSQWYEPVAFESSLSALPSQPNCLSLVDFYLDHAAWLAYSVHGPTFRAEHEAFWSKMGRNELQDDAWLGLLFAVLSISALFMDEDQAMSRGFSFRYLSAVGVAWFNSAIATIFRCGVWSRPLLLTCQILQILSPAFHLTGNTALHQSLTALERTQSLMINLHLLGSHNGDGQEISVGNEVGRRVWWNIIETDWAFIPYHRLAQFSSHQFTTGMPSKPDETTQPVDGFLTLAYRLACYRSAHLIYDVYGHLGQSDAPTYESVLIASNALNRLFTELPAELRFTWTEPTAQGPLNVETTRRRMLAITLAYRSYQIHRLFFVKSLTDPKYAQSRRACLEAAATITAVADRGMPHIYFRLWYVTVSLVAAGIILALETIQHARSVQTVSEQHLPHRDPAERRHQIEVLVERLRALDDSSGIAARGAIFISHLMQVESEISTGQRTDITFTRESILDLVQTRSPVSTPQAVPPMSSSLAADAVQSMTSYDTFNGTSAFPSHAEFDLAALLDDFMATVT